MTDKHKTGEQDMTPTLVAVPPPSQKTPFHKTALASSDSIEWGTPQDLFDAVDEEFGFELDACATGHNAKCDHYIDATTDSLSVEWGEHSPVCWYTGGVQTVWMNPPWGRNIGSFIERAYLQSQKHQLVVVCLLPATTDTSYWHEWVWKASEVRLISGRLKFVREDGHTGPCPKGAALAVFTPWCSGPPRVVLADRCGRVM